MNSTFELLHSSREVLKSSHAILLRSAGVIRDSRAIIKATHDRVQRSQEMAHAPLCWLGTAIDENAPSAAHELVR